MSERLARVGRLGLGVPLLMVALLAMVVVPLPPFLLDLFFTFNITLSLVIMLAVIYVRRPLDFAVFPTVLLGVTLLRLALNVASTRVVLLHGHTGTDAAGPRDRSVRQIRDRRQLRRRHRGVRDPRGHQLHGRDEGRGPRVGSHGAVHVGRHARQADGDRRRLERGPHHAGAGRRPARRGGPGGRLLRRDGRRQQVRARRRGRRHSDSRDQHHRRSRDRSDGPRHVHRRCGPRVHAVDDRRRPRRAASRRCSPRPPWP